MGNKVGKESAKTVARSLKYKEGAELSKTVSRSLEDKEGEELSKKFSRSLNIEEDQKISNLQDDAYEVIMKNREFASPKHSSTKDLIDKSVKHLSPNAIHEIHAPGQDLLKRLKNVYVSSTDVKPSEVGKEVPRARSMPQMRGSVGRRFGSDIVPYGKATISNVVLFVTGWKQEQQKLLQEQHRQEEEGYEQEAEKFSVKSIADKYKLDEENVANVLKYFGTFKLIAPVHEASITEKDVPYEAIMAERVRNTPELTKQLGPIAMATGKGEEFLDAETLVFPKAVPASYRYDKVTLLDPIPAWLNDKPSSGDQEGEKEWEKWSTGSVGESRIESDPSRGAFGKKGKEEEKEWEKWTTPSVVEPAIDGGSFGKESDPAPGSFSDPVPDSKSNPKPSEHPVQDRLKSRSDRNIGDVHKLKEKKGDGYVQVKRSRSVSNKNIDDASDGKDK